MADNENNNQTPQGAVVGAANTPPPVAPQNAPEVKQTAESLAADGVNVKGLDAGIDESGNAPAPAPAPAPDLNVAAQQAREQADLAAASGAFAATKAARVSEMVKAMAAAGVIYEDSYVLAMPSVRDAKDEIALTTALHGAMASLMKAHKDIKVLGGDKENFVMSAGTDRSPQAGGDWWKCPKCNAVSTMQFVNDENQPFEVCPMCVTAVRKDYAQNLFRVVNTETGKTVQEIQREQQQQEAE